MLAVASLPSEGSAQNSCLPRFLNCRPAFSCPRPCMPTRLSPASGGKARDLCGARRGAADADGAPGGATRGAARRRGAAPKGGSAMRLAWRPVLDVPSIGDLAAPWPPPATGKTPPPIVLFSRHETRAPRGRRSMAMSGRRCCRMPACLRTRGPSISVPRRQNHFRNRDSYGRGCVSRAAVVPNSP